MRGSVLIASAHSPLSKPELRPHQSRASAVPLRGLPTFFLGFWVAASSCRMFDFRINLATNHKHQASNVEPDNQNDNCTKGAISFAIAIKEMQIDSECERGQQPQCDPY